MKTSDQQTSKANNPLTPPRLITPGATTCHEPPRQQPLTKADEPESDTIEHVSTTQSTPPDSSVRNAHILRLLRWTGALILGVAAICYLISGWVGSSPLVRTGSFLGFTVLLSIAGIFCAYRWHEDKGARTFLGLASAFVLANFAQLGALVYAQFEGSMAYEFGLRKVFTFTPVGTPLLIVAISVCLLVLLPVTYTGFSALVRGQAKRMTALYIAGNLLLILPWRSSVVVTCLCAIITTSLLITDRRWFSREANLRTWDGRAMRCLLFAPVALIIGRNLFMHTYSSLMLSLVFGASAWLFFRQIPDCLTSQTARISSQLFAYGCLFGAWVTGLAACIAYRDIPEIILIPTLMLPWCVGVFLLSLKSAGRGTITRALIAVACLISTAINMILFADNSLVPSIIGLVVGLSLLLSSFAQEETTELICGLITLLISVGYHIHSAFALIQDNLWISLAIAGISVILSASYLERHGGSLRQRLRTRFKDWH